MHIITIKIDEQLTRLHYNDTPQSEAVASIEVTLNTELQTQTYRKKLYRQDIDELIPNSREW